MHEPVTPAGSESAGRVSAGAPADADALLRDIRDELDDHLACAEQDAARQGVTGLQAAEAAHRAFGDVRSVARELFFLHGGVWLMVSKFIWFVLLV